MIIGIGDIGRIYTNYYHAPETYLITMDLVENAHIYPTHPYKFNDIIYDIE